MDILIGIVIAIFIITAAYVGYFASQSVPEGETHNFHPESQVMSFDSDKIIFCTMPFIPVTSL